MKNASFIVLEGIDGSGKSTQATLLSERFAKEGLECISLAEPSNGSYGIRIREMLTGTPLPVQEQLELFMLDREDDAKRNIRPALEKGITVILDRYYFSNAAYQGALGLDPFFILNENKRCGFPEPNKVFFIDITPETAIERITKRQGEEREIFEKKEFLHKVRENFISIMDERCVIINGAQEIKTIHSEIISNIDFLHYK